MLNERRGKPRKSRRGIHSTTDDAVKVALEDPDRPTITLNDGALAHDDDDDNDSLDKSSLEGSHAADDDEQDELKRREQADVPDDSFAETSKYEIVIGSTGDLGDLGALGREGDFGATLGDLEADLELLGIDESAQPEE